MPAAYAFHAAPLLAGFRRLMPLIIYWAAIDVDFFHDAITLSSLFFHASLMLLPFHTFSPMSAMSRSSQIFAIITLLMPCFSPCWCLPPDIAIAINISPLVAAAITPRFHDIAIACSLMIFAIATISPYARCRFLAIEILLPLLLLFLYTRHWLRLPLLTGFRLMRRSSFRRFVAFRFSPDAADITSIRRFSAGMCRHAVTPQAITIRPHDAASLWCRFHDFSWCHAISDISLFTYAYTPLMIAPLLFHTAITYTLLLRHALFSFWVASFFSLISRRLFSAAFDISPACHAAWWLIAADYCLAVWPIVRFYLPAFSTPFIFRLRHFPSFR